ncbi:MAG: IS3 family transposase [Peptococcus niger]
MTLKKKIVEEYLNGNAGHKILAKKYQIGESQIRRWVNNYKHFGDEGLMRFRNKCEYSVEFKLEAIEQSKACPYRRTFHSDLGWGQQMTAYQAMLKKHHIFQSMSRKGNCYDNAPMENFFSLLKREIYDSYVYRSRQELVRTIEDFIRYYNNDRIKEKLGGLSPKQYRERMTSA